MTSVAVMLTKWMMMITMVLTHVNDDSCLLPHSDPRQAHPEPFQQDMVKARVDLYPSTR